MNMDNRQHRSILQKIAHRAMLQRGLLPDFSKEALAELGRIQAPASMDGERVRDLSGLLWASIDNDDSLDLDQLTVAEAMPGDKVKILVAVADVDSLVKNGLAIDEHARHNTTSVYTAGTIFPMLPEKLSTDLTSLNFDEDRLAIVVEMVIGEVGSLQDSDIYRASVRNHAKLAYSSVAAWIEGNGSLPAAVAAIGKSSLPYSDDELEALAKHCTEEEDAANKVERQVGKSAAAMLLEHRIGEQFDAIVTGAADKGTWARLITVPVEGRVVHGFEGLDVGNRIRVQLTFVDVDRGFIDFRKVGPSKH